MMKLFYHLKRNKKLKQAISIGLTVLLASQLCGNVFPIVYRTHEAPLLSCVYNTTPFLYPNQVVTLTPTTKDVVSSPILTDIGVFNLTAYCACTICCGPNAHGVTSTGAPCVDNHTIGVDPNTIPYGTHVFINGIEYVAEDTGNYSGNHIDIYFATHQDALNFGVQAQSVYVATYPSS